MGLTRIRVSSIRKIRQEEEKEKMKDIRIQDLELSLADAVADNVDLQMRLQDLELAFADQLVGGVL